MHRIVVGIDGSHESRLALRWAIDHARGTGMVVEALLAWDYLSQIQASGKAEFRPQYGELDARRALDEIIDQVADPEHRVEIIRTVVQDLPARALVEASRRAGLVVVGARGLGGFRGLTLGSVGQHVSQHAQCPVLIVRDRPADESPRVTTPD